MTPPRLTDAEWGALIAASAAWESLHEDELADDESAFAGERARIRREQAALDRALRKVREAMRPR